LHGLVVPAYEGYERNSEDLTMTDLKHKVQVLLAGRAAEHLLLGPKEVSAHGSSSDLKQATKLASSIFGVYGLSDDYTSDAASGHNLAVVINDASPSEALHVEGLVRRFLQNLFLENLKVLELHRKYLDSLVTVLVDRKVLLQKDVLELYESSVCI